MITPWARGTIIRGKYNPLPMDVNDFLDNITPVGEGVTIFLAYFTPFPGGKDNNNI